MPVFLQVYVTVHCGSYYDGVHGYRILYLVILVKSEYCSQTIIMYINYSIIAYQHCRDTFVPSSTTQGTRSQEAPPHKWNHTAWRCIARCIKLTSKVQNLMISINISSRCYAVGSELRLWSILGH